MLFGPWLIRTLRDFQIGQIIRGLIKNLVDDDLGLQREDQEEVVVVEPLPPVVWPV